MYIHTVYNVHKYQHLHNTSCIISAHTLNRSYHVSGSGCFPLTATVVNKSSALVQIQSLQQGDEVLSFGAQGEPIFSKVILQTDYSAMRLTGFLQITTNSGHKLLITVDHLIPSKKKGQSEGKCLFAKYVKVGDEVRVFSAEANQFHLSAIIEIGQCTAPGFCNVLTKQGTLVVNGVLASCYACFDDQHLAHLA